MTATTPAESRPDEASCSLPPDALERRRDELQRDFAPRIRGAHELADGIAFRFASDPETAAVVAAFVAFEQQCCSFARYTTERRGSDLVLEIRGPEGTRELLGLLVPEDVEIERPVPSARSAPLKLGASGAIASAAALLLCATPALPLVLGAVGLGHVLGKVGWWVDAIAVPAFLACGGLVAWGFHRRRRAERSVTSAGCGC